MEGAVDVIEVGPLPDIRSLFDELRKPRAARHLLVRGHGVHVGDEALAAMLHAATAPMAASVSPLPVASGRPDEVLTVTAHERLPPPPTLALGCPEACLFSRDALDTVPLGMPADGTDWRAAFVLLNQRLVHAGWRHVAAPGAVLAWGLYPAWPGDTDGVWGPSLVEDQNGHANEGLSTHQLWADTRLRPVRIVIDGACLTDAPHNGSQAVVANVSRALQRVRPNSSVLLAVPERFISYIAAVVAEDGVEVAARERGMSGFDAVYRPYQLLDPGELTWLAAAAQRLVLGQLDMIAFSNPSYHPSPALFHAVRNLQRHTMRFADAVTFISDFGLQCALAECPDLERSRCFVVSCGADTSPPAAELRTLTRPQHAMEPPFVVCMAATFLHKNRRHAIAIFDDLCRRHTYPGRLVIAGPEPHYGRSIEEERRLVAALLPEVRDRIVYLGQVDDRAKWWLLRTADLVLYPSVVEGFGLLPFEAAAVGTPSLSHASSAVLEVLGDGPAVVHSWSASEWADAAARIIGSPARAAEVVSSVARSAALHTWDESAHRVWDAIDATLARPHAIRHNEEGGRRSRVADEVAPIATGVRVAHFANRLSSYLRRRMLIASAHAARRH